MLVSYKDFQVLAEAMTDHSSIDEAPAQKTSQACCTCGCGKEEQWGTADYQGDNIIYLRVDALT